MPRIRAKRSRNSAAIKTARATIGHNNPPPDDPLAGRLVVRAKDAWHIIGCGHSTGWKLVKEGKLTVSRVGSMTLIHARSIRELLGLIPTE